MASGATLGATIRKFRNVVKKWAGERQLRPSQVTPQVGLWKVAAYLLLARSRADRCDAVIETFWNVQVAISLENEKARSKDLNELANLLRGA
jgi:hypothetical protein